MKGRRKWESWEGGKTRGLLQKTGGAGKGSRRGITPRGGRQEQPWRGEPSLHDASAAPSASQPEALAQVSQDPKPSIPNPASGLWFCPSSFNLLSSPAICMCPSSSFMNVHLTFLSANLKYLWWSSSSCFWAHLISSNFCLKLIWAKLFGVSCFLHSELSFCFEGYFFLNCLYFFLYSDFSTPFFDIYLIYVLSTCVLADFKTLINYWLFKPNLFLFYFSSQMWCIYAQFSL